LGRQRASALVALLDTAIHYLWITLWITWAGPVDNYVDKSLPYVNLNVPLNVPLNGWECQWVLLLYKYRKKTKTKYGIIKILKERNSKMNLLNEIGIAFCDICDNYTDSVMCSECSEESCSICLDAYGCENN
jgi:hypothetical protein